MGPTKGTILDIYLDFKLAIRIRGRTFSPLPGKSKAVHPYKCRLDLTSQGTSMLTNVNLPFRTCIFQSILLIYWHSDNLLQSVCT